MNSDVAKIHRMSNCYLSAWDNGNKVVRQIYHYWRGGPRSYLGRCYATFKLRGSAVFIDFKQFIKAHDYMSIDELTSALWAEYVHNAQRIRTTKQHGRSSLEHLFLTEFMKTHGYKGERARTKIRKCYYYYLATQCLGMIAEYETYLKLKEVLANSSVRLANSSDERRDVDLYIDDVPVSVKCFKAFNEGGIRRYRMKSDTPMLYMNEQLNHYIISNGCLKLRSREHLETTLQQIRGSR